MNAVDETPADPAVGTEEHSMEKTEKVRIEQNSFGGMLWVGAWLFTLGFLELGFWRGVLALLVWPYFLGSELSYLLAP